MHQGNKYFSRERSCIPRCIVFLKVLAIFIHRIPCLQPTIFLRSSRVTSILGVDHFFVPSSVVGSVCHGSFSPMQWPFWTSWVVTLCLLPQSSESWSQITGTPWHFGRLWEKYIDVPQGCFTSKRLTFPQCIVLMAVIGILGASVCIRHFHSVNCHLSSKDWRALVAMLLTVPPMLPGLATAITPTLRTRNAIHLYVSGHLVFHSKSPNLAYDT